MSDFTSGLNRFKLFYIPKGLGVEKDIRKEEVFTQYNKKVSLALTIPIAFQFYQLLLINKPQYIAQLNRVRQFKWTSLLLSTAYGVYEMVELDRKWLNLERKFPERSAYQKNLATETELYVLRKKEEKAKTYTQAETDVYKKLYSLGTHTRPNPVKNRIPVDFRPDDE